MGEAERETVVGEGSGLHDKGKEIVVDSSTSQRRKMKMKVKVMRMMKRMIVIVMMMTAQTIQR